MRRQWTMWTVISGLVAFVLAIIIGLGLAGAIVATAVDEQLADPALYVEGLAQNGVFETLAESYIPKATADRIRARWPDASETVVQEAAFLARRIFPPSWFRTQARSVAGAMTTFLTGESDHMKVSVPVDDRLKAVVQMLRVRLPVSPLTTVAYNRIVSVVAGEISKQQRLPFGCSASNNTWIEAVKLAAPEAWVAENLASHLDHIVKFLIGETKELAIRIPLEQRQAGVAAAIKLVIESSNVLDFLTKRVVDDYVVGKLRDVPLVPSANITLSRKELLETLTNLLDSNWVMARRTDITRALADYLAGSTTSLALDISLVELKVITTERVAQRVSGKVIAHLKTLDPCNPAQTTRLLIGKADPLSCNPSGRTRPALMLLLEGFIRAETRKALDTYVPDRWEQTEEVVRNRIGEGTWGLIQQGRAWMKDGVFIGEPTLRRLAETRRVRFIDEVLRVTRGGFVVTENDLPMHHLGATWPELRREIDPFRAAIYELRNAAVPFLGIAAGALMLLLLLVTLRTHTRLMWAGAGAIAGGLTVLIGTRMADSLLEPWVRGLVKRASEDVSSTLAAELARHAPALLEYVVAQVDRSVDQPAGVLLGVGVAVVLGATAEAVRIARIPELPDGVD
ncbi:MAG: hypothetical protein ACI9OJ_004168 [Myxococcota bacterium]|jgi:hypothetical protein